MKIKEMNSKLINLKTELNQIIKKIKDDKKSISGYGAARSGTTLLSLISGVCPTASIIFSKTSIWISIYQTNI